MAKTPEQPALETEPETDELLERITALENQLGPALHAVTRVLNAATYREPEPDTRTLDERMAAVQRALEDVPRAGHAVVTMRAGGTYTYDYITEADLMKGIRPLLAENGIAVYYSDRIIGIEGGMATVEVTLTLAANGEERILRGEGVGTDLGDKHANKAKTSAVRYLLWKTFLQPSDEDPEQENVAADQAAAAEQGRRTASDRPATRRQAPAQTRGKLLERVATLAVELDEVQGRPPGATLGEIPELIRTALENEQLEYPAGLTDPQLVELAGRLQRHVAEERRRAGTDGYEPATLKLRD